MKRVLFVVSLSLSALACGPAQPPKQANIPDPVDPIDQNTASTPAGSKSSGGNDVLGNPPGPSNNGPVGKTPKGEAPQVGSLATLTDGIKWGTTHAELTKAFTDNGGVIWKDYDEKLAKARVGPEQAALEAERDSAKRAFARSFIEFQDTPTGYDATGIKTEYTYKNKESLMWVQRQGKKRYFFFINDRLWKIYDEVPLSESGPLGHSYLDAVNTMIAKIGAQGRVLGADPAKGIHHTTMDWKDATSHARVIDRSGEKPPVVGVVIEDLSTLSNLASLRSNKVQDPTEIDPSVHAVTGGLTDPNAPAPGKKPPPKKK